MKHALGFAVTVVSLFMGCSSDPGSTTATPDGGLDGGEDAGTDSPTMSNVCPMPTAPNVEHQGTISADETWKADAIHVVTFGVDVKGATLTIEPCAIVHVKEGFTITIGGSNPGDPPAKLVAHGTSDGTSTRPITITSDDETKYWGSLAFFKTGSADLEQLTLHHGGNRATAQNGGGTLVVFGDDNRHVPTPLVHAKSIVIDGSASYGINVARSGGFTADSSDVTVRASGAAPADAAAPAPSYPIYVETPSVQTLPAGTYTGNAIDAILVANPSSLDGDESFHDRGVPYRIKDAFSIGPSKSVQDGGLATLTIDAGVTIKLLKTPGNVWGIGLGKSNGAAPANIFATRLVAPGTAAKPIVITSAADAPAAGDWEGIAWAGGPATGNVMTYVTVEYGGGASLTEGFGCGPTSNDALMIFTYAPGDAFIQNCTFAHSAGGGIVSGWSGTGPNLKTGNTFTDIAAPCQVSEPVPPAGCGGVQLCYP